MTPIGGKEYNALAQVSGPILTVERVEDVGYAEVVEVRLPGRGDPARHGVGRELRPGRGSGIFGWFGKLFSRTRDATRLQIPLHGHVLSFRLVTLCVGTQTRRSASPTEP